jgi:hypothetical protein
VYITRMQVILGEQPSPAEVQQPHVRDELLTVSQELCWRIGFAAFSVDRRIIYWANTKDFNPGIGMQARLDRPYGDDRFQVVAAHLITYPEPGEMSMLVDRDQPADMLDGNAFAISMHRVFSSHLSAIRNRLTGV